MAGQSNITKLKIQAVARAGQTILDFGSYLQNNFFNQQHLGAYRMLIPPLHKALLAGINFITLTLMKNVISFLTGIPKENIDSKELKSIIIDIVTIGLGTVIFLSSIFDYRVKQDGVILGSSLLISGILIRNWRKALHKK